MTKKYYCPVCGYESDEPIDVCPVCGAKMAVREEGETSWAAEHKVGIIDGVSEEIVQGLRENFQGECTEVGMYLAMARVAHREGYPEIGLYWEKAAYEEADHASRFAEMLGEVVTDSTKKNLEMRAAAENGATLGKTQLAKLAKEQGLDAIHDAVHEMARDEARHGKAFEGLLKRYFAEEKNKKRTQVRFFVCASSLATRLQIQNEFGRNSPGDCFVASDNGESKTRQGI